MTENNGIEKDVWYGWMDGLVLVYFSIDGDAFDSTIDNDRV